MQLAGTDVERVAVADDGEGIGGTALRQGGDELDPIVDVASEGVGDRQLSADEIAESVTTPRHSSVDQTDRAVSDDAVDGQQAHRP